jgi:RNA polymerase sigma-70 factor (ECF subfamily)
VAEAASDAELLHRWREGSKSAGSELFGRYFRRLSRFFANKVEHEVEELIQRTFVAAVEGQERLRDDASFPSYLFGIARHVLYAHFRGRMAQSQRDVDIDDVSVFALTRSSTSIVASREEQRLILEALRRIPLVYQIVIELHYWEDLDTNEIAEITCVPAATVRTRLRRGRKLVEEQLAELASSPDVLEQTTRELEAWARSLRARIEGRA